MPVRGDSGAVERIHGFAQDVTELARAESQQRTAAALGRLALSGVTFDVLMREAVDAVAEELQLDFAGVAEARSEGGRLVVRWLSGRGTPARGEVELDDESMTAGCCAPADPDRARLGAGDPLPRAARP